MDKRNLFERTKKRSNYTFKDFMKASFVPGRMIVNKIKALRFTLAGRDDGMRAFYSRSRRWSRPGRDGCLARFAVAMIGEQICCDAICKCNWAVCAADIRAATEGWEGLSSSDW
jgi:hypothetical protein